MGIGNYNLDDTRRSFQLPMDSLQMEIVYHRKLLLTGDWTVSSNEWKRLDGPPHSTVTWAVITTTASPGIKVSSNIKTNQQHHKKQQSHI